MSVQDGWSLIHRIGKDPLKEIKKVDILIDAFTTQTSLVVSLYSLKAHVSVARLREAHYYWLADLKRIGDNELDGANPDHFKQAGHLSYWLRRTRPVTSIEFDNSSFSTQADLSPDDAYREEYRVLFNYLNEYIAFEIGFHISLFYYLNEISRPRVLTSEMYPSWDFIECLCHFLNSKNVSPHALFLIFKGYFDALGATEQQGRRR
jgi:hypothetical protein